MGIDLTDFFSLKHLRTAWKLQQAELLLGFSFGISGWAGLLEVKCIIVQLQKASEQELLSSHILISMFYVIRPSGWKRSLASYPGKYVKHFEYVRAQFSQRTTGHHLFTLKYTFKELRIRN